VTVPAIENADVEGDVIVVEGGGTNANGAEREEKEEKVEDRITEALDGE
jgi:hypothetical protein